MANSTFKGMLMLLVLSIILFVSVSAPSTVSAQAPPEITWIEGPTTVDLGDVAQVELGEEYIFADGEDAREINEYNGDTVTGLEVGLICPEAEDQYWAVFFDYDPIGYVKDDEKESLDSTEILKSITQGNDEQNKIRVERGMPPIEVIGWYEEPHHDVDSHNLVWCVQGECEGVPLVNYQTRLLGRHGYMAVVLVSDLATLTTAKAGLEYIIASFSWKSGKSYAEWLPGDKVAEIGLAALVVGGAGAVLAKTGLLGKIWKFLVAGFMVLVGAIVGLIKRLRGKSRASTA